MRNGKKLGSLLLALALACGCLGARAAAQSVQPQSAVHWEELYFISSPPLELSVPYMSDFTLSVDVHAPAGAELTYKWYYTVGRGAARREGILEGIGATFHCTPGDSCYPEYETRFGRFRLAARAGFSCNVTAVLRDANGNEVDSIILGSPYTWVTAQGSSSFVDALYDLFVSPWLTAAGMHVLYPVGVVVVFFTNLAHLFSPN